MVISIYVFSLWGLCPQTHTRVLPLDPAEGLLSPVPLLCPPPKQISGNAPDDDTGIGRRKQQKTGVSYIHM